MITPTSHKIILSGKNAFYKKPDYKEKTILELSSNKALPPSYSIEFESKIVRIAKLIFSLILFPIFLGYIIHNLIGRLIYPASFLGNCEKISFASYKQLNLEGPWKYKRFSLEVDGNTIDATVICHEETVESGRFVLRTFGNAESYEINDYAFNEFLSEIKANAIVFDVPGVGLSSGGPDRSTMAKAYRAMLLLLEDREGFAAREIIGYGFSIGALVQAEGLLDHPLQKHIDYLFIKDRTLASVAEVAGTILGFVVKIAGWNQAAVASSLQLQAKEIIIQTAKVRNHAAVINDPTLIKDDGVIPASASLGKALLGKNTPYLKKFIGTSLTHNQGFINPQFLAEEVNLMLKKPS